MNTLLLKPAAKVNFSATTLRYARNLSWTPGELQNVPQTFEYGVGDLQCNQVVDGILSIDPSTTYALDLWSNLLVVDYDSFLLSLKKLKYFHLVNLSSLPLTFDPTTTNGLVTPISDAIDWQPGNAIGPFWHPTTGWTIDSTHKIWNIVNGNGSPVDVSFVLGGLNEVRVITATYIAGTPSKVRLTFNSDFVDAGSWNPTGTTFTGGNPSTMTVNPSVLVGPNQVDLHIVESVVAKPTAYNLGANTGTIVFKSPGTLDSSTGTVA